MYCFALSDFPLFSLVENGVIFLFKFLLCSKGFLKNMTESLSYFRWCQSKDGLKVQIWGLIQQRHWKVILKSTHQISVAPKWWLEKHQNQTSLGIPCLHTENIRNHANYQIPHPPFFFFFAQCWLPPRSTFQGNYFCWACQDRLVNLSLWWLFSWLKV